MAPAAPTWPASLRLSQVPAARLPQGLEGTQGERKEDVRGGGQAFTCLQVLQPAPRGPAPPAKKKEQVENFGEQG